MTTRPQVDPTESLRNTRRSMGDGTLGGRLRIATPYDPRRLRRATSAITGGGAAPVGETVALTGTVTVAGGGTAVMASLDTIQAQHGFGSVDVAGDVPALPVTATYLAEVDIRWTDGHRDTSVPEVTLDGTAIGQVWPDDGQVWGRWSGQVAFAGTRGDSFDVKVTPSDGAQHDAEVTVRLTVIEPLRTIVETLPYTPPSTLQPQTQYDTAASGTVSLVHGAPASGVAEGDLLVVAITGIALTVSTGGSLAVDNDWTVRAQLQHPTHSSVHFAVATKIADAADAAGTSSYSHTLSGFSTHWGSCCCTVIPRKHGATLSSAVTGMSTGTPITLTPPAGDWVLAVALHKERIGIDDVATNRVTSPGDAVELASHAAAGYGAQESSIARRGTQWIYATDAGEDVTATPVGGSWPVDALVLLGVS